MQYFFDHFIRAFDVPVRDLIFECVSCTLELEGATLYVIVCDLVVVAVVLEWWKRFSASIE